MPDYETLRRAIVRTRDLVDAFPMVQLACSVDNDQTGPRNVERLEFLLPRYSVRMLYHAQNFVDRLLNFIEQNRPMVPPNGTLGFKIGREIYFEFDAFLYSAKSLFENNMLKNARAYLTESRLQAFEEQAHLAYQGFIAKFLLPLRDEAVHLNYMGTSVSEMALLSDKDGSPEIWLHTTFKQDGRELNLVEVFSALAALSLATVQKMIFLLIGETVVRMGMPGNLDVQYRLGESAFRLGDLIDGKDGPK